MRKLLLILSALTLAACQKSSSLEPAATSAIENVTCPQSQSRLYDVMYKSLVDFEQVPSEAELRSAFESALKANPQIQVQENQLLGLVSEFYQILLRAPQQSPQELLSQLTALEIGDQSTDEAKQLQSELTRFQEKWDRFRAEQDQTCTETKPSLEIAPTPIEPEVSLPVLVGGARKVLVTAYQSCDAGELPPMTAKTPDAQGITRVGTHPDGIGARRAITDLKALQKTDYYLQKSESSSSCKDIRSNPLIYDYGGKPKTSAEETSPLDLFTNAGSGTSVRGIDCSAFVFSAIATSGLKLHPDKKMKAILVHGISSTMFLNPAANGLSCFEKVTMGSSGTLKAGDVVAVSGHVLLIDAVGPDPLGISKAKTIADCDALTFKNFDFAVTQSSPSKNGIGINRYQGSDYLSESSAMRLGFEAYARKACAAKLQKKDVLMTADNFQISRHSQKSTCRDKAISLVGESCAHTCNKLAF